MLDYKRLVSNTIGGVPLGVVKETGSAIDGRGVPGVMIESVQRETNTLKEHHQQFEEAQLACTRQTSVRNRVMRTEHLDGGTHAKEQRISCEGSNCAHHSERS